MDPSKVKPDRAGQAATAAWLIASVYYLYQYVLRAAPSVMMPELSGAFGLSTAALASLLGLFYFAYAPFSLVAGVAVDQLGPRRAMPLGAVAMAVGALLFALGDPTLAALGRLLQGAGAVFSMIGAAYVAARYFPASRAATLIGATQMFGMAGATAGQFLVAPAIARGLGWSQLWFGLAAGALALAVLMFVLVPSGAASTGPKTGWLGRSLAAMGAVFRNPQTLLCGLIAGLLFIPTTIFDMVWGVRFLQEGHDMPFAMAVMRSAAVPLGWIVGCPLLGMASDRLGRRRPVILAGAITLLACLALILYGPPGLFPPFSLGLVAGVASGAAMLPFTVVKEANRPEHSGTATGVLNFIAFGLSALLGPVFGRLLSRAAGGAEAELGHYQTAFQPLLYGVALAILLTVLLRETGPAARVVSASGAPQASET